MGDRGMHVGRVGVLVGAIAVTLVATAGAGSAVPLLAENWRDMSPAERYEALRNYHRHERLPQDRQRDIEKRYERWQEMSPNERARIKQNYQRFQNLPPGERERFQRKYEKWRQQQE